jgi:tRNA nucleotidyltransferase/poly(A) polymerase
VGGSLRDTLLGSKPLDYDIVVKDSPLSYAQKIAGRTNGHLISMGRADHKIIRVVGKNTIWDISKMTGNSIEEDLARRDFTINALAYDTATHKVIDISGGLDDLKKRCIRMVSDSIFKEDPLRLLRAYRLGAFFEFGLDPSTASCIKRDAHLICQSAGERIRDELFKIFSTPDSFTAICQMATSGLLFELLPEVGALKGCCRNQHHAYDALEHTLKAYKALEALLKNIDLLLPDHANQLNRWFNRSKKSLLKCALLLHDIGKPLCKIRDQSGIVHFIGHEKTGALMAGKIGSRLKFSNHEIDTIVFVIRNHLRPLSLFMARQKQTLTPKGIARFFMHCQKNAVDILLHAVADSRAKNQDHQESSTKAFTSFIKELIDHYFTRYLPLQSEKPLITGRDLIEELHLQPSPLFKTILSQVREAHLAGHIANRGEALTLARAITMGIEV